MARTEREPFVQRTAIFIPIAVIGLLSLPMLLTSRSFGTDWTLHLWLVRQQQWNIEALGHPGLFVSAEPLGAFYPVFAFVGSGIYSVGGYLAILLGDRPIVAYKLLYFGGLCLGYGGLTWLSLQRGLRRWRSQVAGLIFVTAAHFITDLASRGDLGELIALSSVPFLLAAINAVVTSPRLRIRHVLAVVLAVFVFTGSHNITLLWGSVFIATVALVVLIAYTPQLRRRPPWKRVAALVGSAAIGAGLNAWYLFPDVRYGLDTSIARRSRGDVPTVVPRFGFLLGALRPGYPIRVTVPLLFVLWAIVAEIALWRDRNGVSKRLFFGVLAVGGIFVAFAVSRSLWTVLPSPFYNIQFTRRLNAYVSLATALLVMLALEWRERGHARAKRALAVALAVIAVFTLVQANVQVWSGQSVYHVPGRAYVPTGRNFNDRVVASRTVIPPSWYSRDDFRDFFPNYFPSSGKRRLNVPIADVHGDTFAGVVSVPDGPAPFRTNISASTRFVRITGIEPIGRTLYGFLVAVRAPDGPQKGPVRLTIRPADTNIFRLGSLISLLSLLALCGMLVAWPLAWAWSRRSFAKMSP